MWNLLCCDRIQIINKVGEYIKIARTLNFVINTIKARSLYVLRQKHMLKKKGSFHLRTIINDMMSQELSKHGLPISLNNFIKKINFYKCIETDLIAFKATGSHFLPDL